MTFVGHSLTGASLAVLVVPQRWRPLAKVALAIGFAALANVPDFHFPSWGHERYDISHSVLVNGGLILLAALILLLIPGVRATKGMAWLLMGGALAWSSHFLLDSFYNHGKGVLIFWPLSRARLNLAIPWFVTLKRPISSFGAHTARVLLIEFVVYGMVFGIALAGRVLRLRGQDRPQAEAGQER